MADPSRDGGGGREKAGGSVHPPPFGFFFLSLQKRTYEQKNSIKRVRYLSQIAGNGHFSDLNFQKFLGKHAPKPP